MNPFFTDWFNKPKTNEGMVVCESALSSFGPAKRSELTPPECTSPGCVLAGTFGAFPWLATGTMASLKHRAAGAGAYAQKLTADS
jgi:hypothetical protein